MHWNHQLALMGICCTGPRLGAREITLIHDYPLHERSISREWIAALSRPPICPATFRTQTLAPTRERQPKYRGARTEVIGKISDMANSAVVLKRDTLEVTGLSYPIGSVPDRTSGAL
jgi:hypothetical protein